MTFQSRPSYYRYLLLLLFLPLIVFAQSVSANTELVATIKQVKPSIVGVGTYIGVNRPPATLLGTGFVVGDGSLIVTNYHVVSKPLDIEHREYHVVMVGSGPRPKMLRAKLLAHDDDNDLAVLKIAEKLSPLSLSLDRMADEGTSIAFTGFPIGAVLGLYPVTHRGIIASITPIAVPSPAARLLDAKKINQLRNPKMAYQLDATAYPGNSGSPVYDVSSGKVLGVVNKVFVQATKEDILSKPSGITYAIPVKHVIELVNSLPK